MKLLLAILIEKLDGEWWRMRSSIGEPPEEREGHYILVALLRIVKSKLATVEKENAKEETKAN
jgi:hypothetical protein